MSVSPSKSQGKPRGPGRGRKSKPPRPQVDDTLLIEVCQRFLAGDRAVDTASWLSEQLGDVRVQSLISRFFFDIAWPIADHGGEVHRYIGDEVVVKIVESQDEILMVDTCIGNDKERTMPPWSHLQVLAKRKCLVQIR